MGLEQSFRDKTWFTCMQVYNYILLLVVSQHYDADRQHLIAKKITNMRPQRNDIATVAEYEKWNAKRRWTYFYKLENVARLNQLLTELFGEMNIRAPIQWSALNYRSRVLWR